MLLCISFIISVDSILKQLALPYLFSFQIQVPPDRAGHPSKVGLVFLKM